MKALRPQRDRQLARIHLAKKELAMDDDSYRAMLWSVARVRSARDLDDAGRRNVLDHLASCGSPAARGEIKGRPKGSAATQAQIRKVGALLHQMRLPWSYADGVAKQMWHVDKLDWCTSLQLRGVITALEKEWARRRARELAEEESGR